MSGKQDIINGFRKNILQKKIAFFCHIYKKKMTIQKNWIVIIINCNINNDNVAY
jgi:hypothetical protein